MVESFCSRDTDRRDQPTREPILSDSLSSDSLKFDAELGKLFVEAGSALPHIENPILWVLSRIVESSAAHPIPRRERQRVWSPPNAKQVLRGRRQLAGHYP